jgi:hypothetical protein
MPKELQVGDYVVIKRIAGGESGKDSVSGPVLAVNDAGATIGVADADPVDLTWDDIDTASLVRITGDGKDININVD